MLCGREGVYLKETKKDAKDCVRRSSTISRLQLEIIEDRKEGQIGRRDSQLSKSVIYNLHI